MKEKAEKSKGRNARQRFDGTTVLWTGSLLCGDRSIGCVILKISAAGAEVRVEDTSMLHSSVRLRNPRFGELSGELAWSKADMLGIRFLDDPKTVARAIGDALP